MPDTQRSLPTSGICPVCGKRVRLRTGSELYPDGEVMLIDRHQDGSGQVCSGSRSHWVKDLHDA